MQLPFDQIFGMHDLAVVALLIVMEGVLSIDNALVLGILAKRLPKSQQKKALTYGLVGAFVFRVAAIGFATFLLKWPVVKLLGGGYLVYIAIKHFYDASKKSLEQASPDVIAQPLPASELTGAGSMPYAPVEVEQAPPGGFARFWPTVAVIELTDIAFAVDSILAAIALVGPAPIDTPAGNIHPKLWVIVTGGLLGVILMRYAAILFIKLLQNFPRFETAAYLLVTVIGLKLLADYVGNHVLNSDPTKHPVDFHSYKNPGFWIFWVAMTICFATGFWGKKPAQTTPTQTPTGAA